jgi:hypothetical protein
MLRLLLVHELIGEKLESQSLGKDGLHILADRWMFSRAFPSFDCGVEMP